MMKNKLFTVAVVAVLALSSGCAIGIGNRDQDIPRQATLGQELVDLKSALDSGAISPTEYEEQRRRLLED